VFVFVNYLLVVVLFEIWKMPACQAHLNALQASDITGLPVIFRQNLNKEPIPMD